MPTTRQGVSSFAWQGNFRGLLMLGGGEGAFFFPMPPGLALSGRGTSARQGLGACTLAAAFLRLGHGGMLMGESPPIFAPTRFLRLGGALACSALGGD